MERRPLASRSSSWAQWLGALLAVFTAYIRVLGGRSVSNRISAASCQSSGGWLY
jgi:hypothetical protein